MIGIDITRVSRMENALKNGAFLGGAFTDGEIKYYREKGGRAETAAGLYALKEAAAKALGTGFKGFSLKDIEVKHNGDGAPALEFHNNALKIFRRFGRSGIGVSISHDGDYAAAACYFY